MRKNFYKTSKPEVQQPTNKTCKVSKMEQDLKIKNIPIILLLNP